MDEEEFEYEVVETWTPARKFRAVDLVVLGINLVRELSGAFTSTLTLAQQLVAAHANFQVENDAFREQAAREIETLTNGE